MGLLRSIHLEKASLSYKRSYSILETVAQEFFVRAPDGICHQYDTESLGRDAVDNVVDRFEINSACETLYCRA